MFKIALLYSGQPRHLKEAFPNHHDTFWKPNNSYQIDVFAHMWYDEKWIGNYFWDQYKDRGRWEADLKEFMQDNWNQRILYLILDSHIQLIILSHSSIVSLRQIT